jgi:outer membrane protein assembly factor BamA|tara:strand:- start:362 stop:577 length:216 start_codon:yes stop_codon:yes gene_type:complete
MAKNLNKSFDETIEKLYDTLYEVKEVLDKAEDGELEQMADILIESVEEALTVNEVNIEAIKEHIDSLNDLE